jgi:hypothetical protein
MLTVGMQRAVGFVRGHAQAIAVVALFAAVGTLGLARLDNTAFWDDEAQTGVIARGFLATGRFTGWDGRNLMAYRDGRLLDRNLNTINPPLDSLVAAASFRLFGQTTWAGRFPFVMAGLASLAVFGLIVRRDFRDQPTLWLYALAVLGFSVVFLLNIRQCRYYALGLLFSLLSYDAYRRGLATGRVVWYVVFAGAVVGLFYSSFLYCAAFGGALAVVHVAFHRRELAWKDLGKVGVAVVLAVAAIVPYAVAHRIWYRPDSPWNEMWDARRATLLWWYLRDLNVLGLPWMVTVMLAFVLIRTWRSDRHTRRILEFACLSVGFAVLVAILTPQPVLGMTGADVRYLLPVVPFLAALVAAVLYFVHQRSKHRAAVMFLAVVATNIFSVSPGGWKFQWLLPAYVHEVRHDYPTAYGEIIAFLRQHARQDDVVFTCPEYASLPLEFYLGDKIKIGCMLSPQTPLPVETVEELEKAGAPFLNDEHCPDWIVFFGLQDREWRPYPWQEVLAYFSETHEVNGKLVWMCYQEMMPLDIYCYDTQRPELYLHSFGPVSDFDHKTESVHIFRGKLVPAEAR